jgi:hypothetical protein
MKSPQEEWGIVLYFEAMLALNNIDEAFRALRDFIERVPRDTEGLKWLYVDRAIECDRLQLALDMNARRAVIQPDPPKSYAVAIQCFNKPDTLDKVLAALVRCDETEAFDLVIGQDNAVGSAKQATYSRPAEEVRAVIGKWIPELLNKFNSVEVKLGSRNRGTAPTCRQLLDHVTSKYDGFVFLEDDCVFSKDALRWAHYHLQYSLGIDTYWFASCESIFFDSKGNATSEEKIQLLQEYARRNDVHSTYVEINFVPSTCFITTREVWEKARGVRSFPHGPESLNKYLKSSEKKTLAPVVPRASDIGMLHELGFSVAILGRSHVKEIKETYLTSEGLFDTDKCRLYTENRDSLWSASCLMKEEFIYKLLSKDLS